MLAKRLLDTGRCLITEADPAVSLKIQSESEIIVESAGGNKVTVNKVISTIDGLRLGELIKRSEGIADQERLIEALGSC